MSRPQEKVAEYNRRYRAKHGAGCDCSACTNARAQSLEKQRRYQATTLVGGLKGRGDHWTGEELDIALAKGADGKYLHTPVEAARLVGRTYNAVTYVRKRARADG